VIARADNDMPSPEFVLTTSMGIAKAILEAAKGAPKSSSFG